MKKVYTEIARPKSHQNFSSIAEKTANNCAQFHQVGFHIISVAESVAREKQLQNVEVRSY